MDKQNVKPELAMFTLLNPDFYGVREGQFTYDNEDEQTTANPDTNEGNDNRL